MTTQITVNKIENFLIWGQWEGDQAEAYEQITKLPQYCERGICWSPPQLFTEEGFAAKDNTTSGTFCAGTNEEKL